MSDVFDLFGDLEGQPEPTPAPIPAPPRKKARQPTVAEPVVEPKPTQTQVVEKPSARLAPPVGTQDESPVACGPRFMDCGHLNWYSESDNEAARSEGHCCTGGKRKVVASLIHLKGEYIRPFPTNMRRSPERERGQGFPGYCCDGEGWYIGGIGNDCRYDSPDDRRCAVHGGPPPPIVYDEDEPVIETPVDEPPPSESTQMPKASGSWKQRQMSAKRGRR